MSELAARLQGELNGARKAQDKERVLLLGTVLSDIKNREIELKRALADDDVVEVLRKAIKRRRESAEMYEKGGRSELAAAETREADALGVASCWAGRCRPAVNRVLRACSNCWNSKYALRWD